jgi:peptidoglycan/LPS O-acetylase OafA/YrhL
MARKKKPHRGRVGARGGAAAAKPAARIDRESVLPEWQWRTFPVFFAFVTGMLLAFFVNEGTVNPLAFLLLLAALLGFGYCLAHILVTNFVVAGRVRRRRAARARGEALPEDFEEELVYPGE